jgi:hypothetical protein
LLVAFRVGDELAEDGVGDSTFDDAQRFLLRLAFADLAVVEPPSRSVVADPGDGDDVDGVVQATVAVRVDRWPRVAGGTSVGRGGAGVGSEVVAVSEAGDVTDLTEDEGGSDRADAVEVAQVGVSSTRSASSWSSLAIWRSMRSRSRI